MLGEGCTKIVRKNMGLKKSCGSQKWFTMRLQENE
jgi:hypothetical protein